MRFPLHGVRTAVEFRRSLFMRSLCGREPFFDSRACPDRAAGFGAAAAALPLPSFSFWRRLIDSESPQMEFRVRITLPPEKRNDLFLQKTTPLDARKSLLLKKTTPRDRENGLLGEKTPPRVQRKNLLGEKTLP
jgi:hypothetical protein